MEKSNNGVDKLIDISRGGIAITHNNTLKTGEVIPVHIKYNDLDINTNVKIVSSNSSRAGAEFVGLNKDIANQLLYLSVLLEADNNMLATRFTK
jgi:predicted membrane GTPase involved in stress response